MEGTCASGAGNCPPLVKLSLRPPVRSNGHLKEPRRQQLGGGDEQGRGPGGEEGGQGDRGGSDVTREHTLHVGTGPVAALAPALEGGRAPGGGAQPDRRVQRARG